MPMDYRIDEDRGVVFMRGWGRLINEDMVDCITRLRVDDRLVPGMPTLSDLRDVTEMGIDIEGIFATDKVMAESRETRGPARIAIVVKNQPDAIMARLFDASTQGDNPGLEIKPFETVEDAEAWLGLRP